MAHTIAEAIGEAVDTLVPIRTMLLNLYEWQAASWSHCLGELLVRFRILLDATAYAIYMYWHFVVACLRLCIKATLAILPMITPVAKAVKNEWQTLPLWHRLALALVLCAGTGCYHLTQRPELQGYKKVLPALKRVSEKLQKQMGFLKHLTVSTALVLAIFTVYGLLKLTFSSALVDVLVHYGCLMVLFYHTKIAISKYNMTPWHDKPKGSRSLKDRFDLSMDIFGLLGSWAIILNFELIYNIVIRMMSTFVFLRRYNFPRKNIASVLTFASSDATASSAFSELRQEGLGLSQVLLNPLVLLEGIDKLLTSIHDLFIIMVILAHFAKIEIFTTHLRGFIEGCFNWTIQSLFGFNIPLLEDEFAGTSPRRGGHVGDIALRRRTQWKRVLDHADNLYIDRQTSLELPAWILSLVQAYSHVVRIVLPQQWLDRLEIVFDHVHNWLTFAPHIVCIIFPRFLIRIIHPFATVLVPTYKGLQSLNRWDLRACEFWLMQLFACQLSEFFFSALIATHPNLWFQARIRFVMSAVFAVFMRDPWRHVEATLSNTRILMETLTQSISSQDHQGYNFDSQNETSKSLPPSEQAQSSPLSASQSTLMKPEEAESRQEQKRDEGLSKCQDLEDQCKSPSPDADEVSQIHSSEVPMKIQARLANRSRSSSQTQSSATALTSTPMVPPSDPTPPSMKSESSSKEKSSDQSIRTIGYPPTRTETIKDRIEALLATTNSDGEQSAREYPSVQARSTQRSSDRVAEETTTTDITPSTKMQQSNRKSEPVRRTVSRVASVPISDDISEMVNSSTRGSSSRSSVSPTPPLDLSFLSPGQSEMKKNAIPIKAPENNTSDCERTYPSHSSSYSSSSLDEESEMDDSKTHTTSMERDILPLTTDETEDESLRSSDVHSHNDIADRNRRTANTLKRLDQLLNRTRVDTPR